MTAGALAPGLSLAASGTGRVPSSAEARRERDRRVVVACQQGQREAFDELVERYQRDIYRLCFRYVNNHEDANDMAQDAFLKAYRAHRQVPGSERVLDVALPDRREHLPELPLLAPRRD